MDSAFLRLFTCSLYVTTDSTVGIGVGDFVNMPFRKRARLLLPIYQGYCRIKALPVV